jgi:hypothetical protein
VGRYIPCVWTSLPLTDKQATICIIPRQRPILRWDQPPKQPPVEELPRLIPAWTQKIVPAPLGATQAHIRLLSEQGVVVYSLKRWRQLGNEQIIFSLSSIVGQHSPLQPRVERDEIVSPFNSHVRRARASQVPWSGAPHPSARRTPGPRQRSPSGSNGEQHSDHPCKEVTHDPLFLVVIAQMFEWNWDSVAAECTTFLGPAGYGFVQGEHLKPTGVPARRVLTIS